VKNLPATDISGTLIPPKPHIEHNPSLNIASKHSIYNDESCDVKTASLEDLRQLAIRRGAKAAEDRRAKLENELIVKRKQLVFKLPTILDALRSLAVVERKSIYRLDSLLLRLSRELRMKLSHLSESISILKDIAPEFITIFPPDDMISHEMLKINLIAPYSQLKSKVLALK
jgi:hypothetical protein